jgi:hypothetical protein
MLVFSQKQSNYNYNYYLLILSTNSYFRVKDGSEKPTARHERGLAANSLTAANIDDQWG